MFHLRLEVTQVGDRRGGDIRNVMRSAISGANLPWPHGAPGSSPTACVVAVRAIGGVAAERCTPVFI